MVEGVRIWTVGHSNRSLEGFLSLPAEHGIELLVDVRRYPGSRRHPHFARPALAAALGQAGVGYQHAPDLGGHRPALPGSPNTAWRAGGGLQGYADYMATPAFQRAVEALLARAAERPTVLMCAEANPRHCHRQLLSDALMIRGAEVIHILEAGESEFHRLHANVRQELDGQLIYADPGGDQLALF
jgi:uncharacterized protein (DUF488 family)